MNINPRILGASILGLLLVVVSVYFNAKENESGQLALVRDVNSSKTRSFVKVTDENQNKIPDWQETFSVLEIDLDKISTSTKFVPKTKTEQLAVDISDEIMFRQAGGVTLGGDKDDFLSYKMRQLAHQNTDLGFGDSDVILSNRDDKTAWRSYGNQVAAIAYANPLPADTENEMSVFSKALARDDQEMLRNLEPIRKAYEGMLADMLLVPVPPSLVEEHLQLINSYQSLAKDIEAFENLFVDALPAMLRMSRYYQDVQGMQSAIENLYLKLHYAGIRWGEGDIASRLIRIGV